MPALALAAATAIAGAGSVSAADLGGGRDNGFHNDNSFGFTSGFSWTGGYIGGQLGGMFGDSDGFIGGGTLGYNVQAGQVVYGVETDISGTDASGAVDVDWLWTLRGRVGWALAGNVMPYITAGIAIGDASATLGGVSASETNTGWTIGGGLEFAVDRNWTIKGEYLYVDLQDVTVAGVGTVDADDLHVLRAGLNLKF